MRTVLPGDRTARVCDPSGMGGRARRRAREQPRLARLGSHGTGDRFGALVEAWVLDGPVAELVALHGAESPEALQRVLVIPGRRSDTVPDGAVWAFGRAHADEDTGVVESVVLAVTNRRWTTIARPLLERLTDGGLLDEGHASQLGLCFLEADVVPVTVPGRWLADFYLQQRGDEFGRLDPAKTYTLVRQVSPQVRRWAAARFARDLTASRGCCGAWCGWTAGTLRRRCSAWSTRPIISVTRTRSRCSRWRRIGLPRPCDWRRSSCSRHAGATRRRTTEAPMTAPRPSVAGQHATARPVSPRRDKMHFKKPIAQASPTPDCPPSPSNRHCSPEPLPRRPDANQPTRRRSGPRWLRWAACGRSSRRRGRCTPRSGSSRDGRRSPEWSETATARRWSSP